MKIKPSQVPGEVVLKMQLGDEQLLSAGQDSASAFRMKKILVPIDFSDCATKALQYALPLAKQHGASLTLLYVVPPIYVPGEFGVVDTTAAELAMCEAGTRHLNQLADAVVGQAVSFDTAVRLGSPVLEILDVAKRQNVDAIVISTHGRTGLKHVLLGSVVERVVQRAPCPVLVVREREHEFLAHSAATTPVPPPTDKAAASQNPPC